MLDFLSIYTRRAKNGSLEVCPEFEAIRTTDLMIRVHDFFAIWNEETGLWSTDEQDAIEIIDRNLDEYAKQLREKTEEPVRVMHLRQTSNRFIGNWHRFCKQDMPNTYHELDERVIYSNFPISKRDYASIRLKYPLEKGSIESYDKLMSVLYSPEERTKLEWAIGSIINGDSKKIQKFIVLYGDAGTGKSTILNIIQTMFSMDKEKSYYSVFDAKALGSSSDSFALEPLKDNPLIGIQHDGDLSRIEDNTRLNSLVSHEKMPINTKNHALYSAKFKSFLFMGTNKPVRITDSRSGLLRRLIDVSPTGNKVPTSEYTLLMNRIENFELGAIAYHCKSVYEQNPNRYNNYIPLSMMSASNDFYNFIMDSYFVFKKDDGVSFKSAWAMYNEFCSEARVVKPMSQKVFREELKSYFREYKDRISMEDGQRVRSYYSGFRTEKLDPKDRDLITPPDPLLELKSDIPSNFDILCKNCAAQYAVGQNDAPGKPWDSVTTVLSDILTSKTHYVRVPENHIVIDFDIQDENGNKDLNANLREAAKWPSTYAELSKSGNGVHLHYIYKGDVNILDSEYAPHIEVKVFTGKSALRRKLTKCNDLKIAEISSGLPFKKEKRSKTMVDKKIIENDKHLVSIIEKAMRKEGNIPGTKSAIDLINKALNDAYNSGMSYDVSSYHGKLISFAAGSTHHSSECLEIVAKMHFCSDDRAPQINDKMQKPIVIFDCEIFPNLCLVNWKQLGKDKTMVRYINPTAEDIEKLVDGYRLIGFNNRKYDNHILYAILMGFNNEQLFELSKKLVGESRAGFGSAYNLSYADIYDYLATKQSLKKWEIEMIKKAREKGETVNFTHLELGLPWDQPVPKDQWERVSKYCDNDVLATEALFEMQKADFTAREILADVAKMSVNDTTNNLTTTIIFGKGNKNPKSAFRYRNMGETHDDDTFVDGFDEYTRFDNQGRPVFPDYSFAFGKSIYRGEEVGEGGYVYAEPGIYGNVALLDISSMHPSSIIAEQLFGTEYTQRFQDIRDARIDIKHKDFESAKKRLGGVLAKYLDDTDISNRLAYALKIAINSVYGLTSAKFDNPCRDKRNVDNIVAKRGALFMVNLKHEVQKRGFIVAHIKTDSIKIPDATPEIIQFVMDYGKMYGYNFEHEATYERMCLVNDAVYIAKYKEPHAGEWTATGTQFQIPYVFKKLFSKEEIIFNDLCETKSVQTALYLDYNEHLPEGEHMYEFVGRTGSFCPIKPGKGGGLLMREAVNKKTGETSYAAATGTKGYRWLQSESVLEKDIRDDIDYEYHEAKVAEAIDTINKYGDFNWFVSDDPYVGPKIIDGKPLYFDEPPIY